MNELLRMMFVFIQDFEKGMTFKVPMLDVLYFKRRDEGMSIVTTNQTYFSRKTFEDVWCSHDLFVQCNEEVVVNVSRIAYIKKGVISMEDGVEFEISKEHREAFVSNVKELFPVI